MMEVVVEFRRLKTLHCKLIYMRKPHKGVGMKTRQTVWSSQHWVEYFRRNAASLMVIPWELGIELSAKQRRAIESSVPEFQLGESSDGLRFIEMAEVYALRSGDV